MLLKEAYHLFKSEHKNVPVGLSKFCNLRPQNFKLFDQISHNMCVCMYHENVRLILYELSKHTNLAATFDGFVAQLTCNNSIKECFYHQYRLLSKHFYLQPFLSKDSVSLLFA